MNWTKSCTSGWKTESSSWDDKRWVWEKDEKKSFSGRIRTRHASRRFSWLTCFGIAGASSEVQEEIWSELEWAWTATWPGAWINCASQFTLKNHPRTARGDTQSGDQTRINYVISWRQSGSDGESPKRQINIVLQNGKTACCRWNLADTNMS